MLCFIFQQNRTINDEFDFFEGGREGGMKRTPIYKILILIIIGKYMKIWCFKFHQNRAINKEFDFWRLEGGGWGLKGRVKGYLNLEKIIEKPHA